MRSPYEGLPSNRLWKSAVPEQRPFAVAGLYTKRFEIRRTDRIATAGSCFAQHIGRNLRKRGFNVIDAEPREPGLPAEIAARYGYGLFSARYGNVYTARQLHQLAGEAFETFSPANAVWQRGDRFFDAMRPGVEPDGLETETLVRLHRQRHLKKVASVLRQAEIFVFTFGLTEAWTDMRTGTVYPTAPGTIAGDFDPHIHEFRNFAVAEVLNDFVAFRSLIKAQNPAVKFLLTVSPVPLAATASDAHVLIANTYSKSVLRAVAGELYAMFDDVDYFPAYEIVATSVSKGAFFEKDMRSVSQAGVETVMRAFFRAHNPGPVQTNERPNGSEAPDDADEVVCEDILLDAFAR
jgi:hypothetical protein